MGCGNLKWNCLSKYYVHQWWRVACLHKVTSFFVGRCHIGDCQEYIWSEYVDSTIDEITHLQSCQTFRKNAELLQKHFLDYVNFSQETTFNNYILGFGLCLACLRGSVHISLFSGFLIWGSLVHLSVKDLAAFSNLFKEIAPGWRLWIWSTTQRRYDQGLSLASP